MWYDASLCSHSVCMTLFTDGGRQRVCKWCGERYRPRVEDQKFCGRWCRLEAKKSEARAARSVWRKAGRPTEEQLQNVKLAKAS
jgi:hypothetical protein